MSQAAPTARIYVIEKLRHLESLAIGERSWWCVERAANPGELGVLYVKGKGMALLFKFVGLAEVQQSFCRNFGLATGDIEILAKSSIPIKAQTLREHTVLRRLPALHRSFQRKSFRLDEPYLTALTELLGWAPEPKSELEPK